jgi:ankyrin repeat protein
VHLLQVFDDKSCTSVLSKRDRFSLEMMKSEGARVGEMEIFTYLDHPLNAICSPPGMGKSTLMSRLSSFCPSTYWSVRVNLISHKRVFKEEPVHDDILHHFVQEEEDAFAIKIRSMLLQNNRMYFFLDGLDEIDSEGLQVALDFIKHISSLGHRVWITSRENLKQMVSKELKIFPIKVEELTEKEQKTYIQKRLQDLYQEDEIERITNKIYANVDIVNSRHLLGVPLQLFMVTENFRDNTNLWREPDQEIFVLTKMYKIFFQGKKKHQHRKLGVHEHEDQIGFDFDLYLEQYELQALKSCLDTTTFDKLKINLRGSQKFLENLKTGDPFGIVSRVTDDNQAIFNHQTYAEYFACAWLKKNLDKVSLLQDSLFTKKNQNLKLIFDIMLAEKSELHLAVIYRDTNLVLKHLHKNEVKDEGGRNPLQLLCTYGVKYPLLKKSYGMMYFENEIEGVSTQYREIFKMLSHCDVFQKDDVFRWNCFDYASRLHNLFAVERILERCKNPMSLESLFIHYDTITLAYYSSKMVYPNLLRAAITKNSIALSVRFGYRSLTLLHVVIEEIKKNNEIAPFIMEERIQVITTLIECGLDVDGQCGDKRTALHYASELNDDVIVKVLLEQGANINLPDKNGQNALHIALQNSFSKGVDINVKDFRGRTPLHYTCYRDFHLLHPKSFGPSDTSKANTISCLLENGASVNAKDLENRSVLYYAVFTRNYNCVKVLLDHGADINAVCDSGKTVLHTAVVGTLSPDIEMIQLLLSHGVDANQRDELEMTALDHAVSFSGLRLVVEILFYATAHDQLMSTDYVTFLHYAVYAGNCFAVELFLKSGLDLDKIVVNNERYPLYVAVENQHLRGNLLLKMTEFIRDCNKNGNFKRERIIEFLKRRLLFPLREFF